MIKIFKTTKKLNITLLGLFILTGNTMLQTQEKLIVTYNVSSIDRFGDSVLIYCKSLWIAMKNNTNFLFKPFRYSDQLSISHKSMNNGSNKKTRFVKKESDINPKASDCIFVTNLFTFIPTISHNSLSHTTINKSTNINDICEEALKNKKFGNEVKKNLSPKNQPNINLPNNKITIAVHVRKGGGYDKPIFSEQLYSASDNLNPTRPPKNRKYIDVIHPFKFPPNQFYIDQICMLSTLFNDAPLYIYIFTDDQNPKKLADQFELECNKPNITFDCREHDNHHAKNVIDDLWAISQFDCLIRGWSHFPSVAQMIGNHKIIMFPKKYFWSNKKLIMPEICIILHDDQKNVLNAHTYIVSDNIDEALYQEINHIFGME